MSRRSAAILASVIMAAWLAIMPASQAGWLERWRAARGGVDSQVHSAAVQASPPQVTNAPPPAAPAPLQPVPVPVPVPGPRTPPAGSLSVGPEAVSEPLPEPFSARGGAIGVGPGASGAAESAAGPSAAGRRPAASPPYHTVVEVPTGVCAKKPVVVHCRGCAPGCCKKVCGRLPACVTCQPRTFRVKNPLNQCPVDVTACLPEAPEKARKVERDPYYITYHFPNCRVTIWFLYERNNNYIVEYAPERSF